MALYGDFPATQRRQRIAMDVLATLFGSRCRHCGRHGVRSLGPVAPTQPGNFSQSFALSHCRLCEVVYLDPVPSAADLKLMYEDSAQFNDAHYTDSERVGAILDYYSSALRRLNLLPKAGERVLEVGAGLAWIARACKAIDAGITTVAQDVSSEAAVLCPWVDDYFVGPLELLPWRGSYRLVSLTHVIEHLPDPLAMLRQLASMLAPGGRIFVTAPFRPTGWKPGDGLRGWKDYSYLHVPAHITYFSRRWFDRFAPTCGLRVASWDASHEDGQAFELVLGRE